MNDVEHDEEAESVSLVHHVLQVVGTTVTRRGSEETCHLNKEKQVKPGFTNYQAAAIFSIFYQKKINKVLNFIRS